MWSQRAEQVVSELLARLPFEEKCQSDAFRLNALPIGVDLWAAYYLRPDGEVVVVGEDLDRPDVDTSYSDWDRVLRVLIWGSQRYPELRELIPDRSPDAVDCRCAQHPLFTEGKMICPECLGLGWHQKNSS